MSAKSGTSLVLWVFLNSHYVLLGCALLQAFSRVLGGPFHRIDF